MGKTANQHRGGRHASYPCMLAAAISGLGAASAWGVVQNDQYISLGDNLYQGDWLALDSPAAINASFDMFKNVFNTRRIYWRGLEAQLQNESVLRTDNVRSSSFYAYTKDLLQNQQLNNVALQAAHAHGMQLWGQMSLYDYGSSADVGVYGFPAQHEHPLRADNPQWVPVDKYGVRKQGGPLEYAYGDARTASVNWVKNQLTQTGYDGVLFHTYAENFSARFGDEFGFSDPIVQEYKSRYGVDIRYQAFDKAKWSALRGEYSSAYLQELHNALNGSGKKVGVGIEPTDTDRPMFWLGNSNFPTAGNIELNWKKWATDHSVDTLVVWGGSDATVPMNELIAGTQGKPIELSLMTSSPNDPVWSGYTSQGKVLTVGESFEAEYITRGNIPAQPKSSLSSSNQYFRMRVLGQIVQGTMSATSAEITPLLNDSNILNRRLALRAMGKIGDATALSAMENALSDPDSSVRNAAIYGLIDANRSSSYSAIINAANLHGEFPFVEGAWAVLRQRSEWIPQLVATLQSSTNAKVRALAMRTLTSDGYYGNLGNTQAPAILAAANDATPEVRAYAIDALGTLYNSSLAIQRLIDAMQSNDTVVASRAATAISYALQQSNPAATARRSELIGKIAGSFKTLGDDTQRADKDWAYQPIGNALMDLGTDGSSRLKSFMNQRGDRRLSELAWQVMYLPQRSHDLSLTTEAQDAYAHFKMPRWDKVTAAADDFNAIASGASIDNQLPQTGFQWKVLAGTPSEQVVQTQFTNGGGKALKAVRHDGGSHALQLTGFDRNIEAAELTTVTAKADWMHQRNNDSVVLQLALGSGNGPALYVDPAGEYRIWQTDGTATGGSYNHSGFYAGTNGWETVEMVMSLDLSTGTTLSGNYDVFLTRGQGGSMPPLSRKQIASDISVFNFDERSKLTLNVANQTHGTGDVITYWDNVSLTVDANFANAWTVNGSGDWNQPSNWATGAVPSGHGAQADFLSRITSSRSIVADTAVTVGTLNFDNVHSYVITGAGSLSLQSRSGIAAINVFKGSHTISLPVTFVSDATVNVAAAATVTLANPTVIKANQTVSTTGNLRITAPLTIESGASLVLAAGDTTLSALPALASGAIVDIQQGALSIAYSGTATPAPMIAAELEDAYCGGLWNGDGIRTSLARQGQGIGWIDHAETRQILIRYSFYGDADLSGTVDSADFNTLAAGYGTTRAIWARGDFNYDGRVNSIDFNYVARNFGEIAPTSTLGAVVPEPAAASLSVIALSVATRPRRQIR